jgi:Pyruvate/2-oxoacid:ferredoxin oxidoreductase delta subunit
MDKEEQVYHNLQKHMDSLPIGFPATQSGVEIRVLKRFFTPEEAEIATHLSINSEPIESIYERVKDTDITLERLQIILDVMERKVTIFTTTRDGRKYYRNQVWVVGIFEALVNKLTPEWLQDEGQFNQEGFGREMYRVKTRQMRTIPVEKSIPLPEKYDVATYDNVRELIENNTGQFAVANCICRQANDIAGQPCKMTDLRELCLILDGEQYILAGLGRPITKGEAFNILEKAQEAGLVLQPINSQRPWAICCCCGDCCGILGGFKRLPRPIDFYASNFHSEIDPGLCTGCENCVVRCQLEAPFMKDDIVAINLDRCIGCGNCVMVCPVGAIRLKKKEKETIPPMDTDEMYRQIAAEKARTQ